MTRLTDTQAILLSNAARRDSGALHPLPATITAPAGGIAKSLASLVTRGLAEERVTVDPAAVYRADAGQRYGLYLTAAGRAAIGVEPVNDAAEPRPAPRQTKAALVRSLLARDHGATIAELIAATGWLPHTIRAALTGLRKTGCAIARGTSDGATCYRMTGAA